MSTLNGILDKTHLEYVAAIAEDLRNFKQHDKRSIEKMAASFGITNRNLVKELTELAIVRIARGFASKTFMHKDEIYSDIIALYNIQANLSQRTSESILLQQYSTPAPIAYLAGSYILNEDPLANYFEPSAGNGLLTIALPYEHIWVNEIDDVRIANLISQPFAGITQLNATKEFPSYEYTFDGVITNPPFGTLPVDQVKHVGEFKINTLDHWMALNALDCMKDSGRAAIIIGGHTAWDELGRIQAGKNRIFFNYLYHHYNVDAVINIDGHKLYSRQGTAFDVRLILIDGRKEKPEGYSPMKNDNDTVVYSFEKLWDRVHPLFMVKDNQVPDLHLNYLEQWAKRDSEEFEKGMAENEKRQGMIERIIKYKYGKEFDYRYVQHYQDEGWMGEAKRLWNLGFDSLISEYLEVIQKQKAVIRLRLLKLKSLI